MSSLSGLSGSWVVEPTRSQSIEPLLKAFHVSSSMRKNALSVKFVQEIVVSPDEKLLTIRDVSIHGAKAESYDLTTKDSPCNWDASRSFPLQITTVMPRLKGAIIRDARRMLDETHFEQRLMLKRKGRKTLVLVRVFKRYHPSEDASALGPSLLEMILATVLGERDPDDNHRVLGWLVSLSCVCVGIVIHAVYARVLKAGLYLEILIPTCLAVLTLATARGSVVGEVQQTDRYAVSVAAWLAVLSAASFVMMMFPFHREVSSTSVVSIGSIGALVLGRLSASHASYARVRDDVERYASQLLICLLVSLVLTLTIYSSAPDIIERVSGIVIALLFVMYRVYADIKNSQNSTSGGGEAKEVTSTSKTQAVDAASPVHTSANVRVTGHRVAPDGKYAEFCVTTTHASLPLPDSAGNKKKQKKKGQQDTWQRFSAFDNLRKELRPWFEGKSLPNLPPKSMGRNLKTDFLEERTTELDSFVKELFNTDRMEELAMHDATCEFLGLGSEGRSVLSKRAGGGAGDGVSGNARVGVPGVGIYDEAVVAALKRAKKMVDGAYNASKPDMDSDGWSLHSSAGGTDCFLKKEGEFTYTKGVGIVQQPMAVVLGFLADPTKRTLHDDMWKSDTPLGLLDVGPLREALGVHATGGEIVWSQYKSPFPMAIAQRDSVLASCEYFNADAGSLSVVLSSVSGYKAPSPKYVRAEVFAAGLIFEPINEGKATRFYNIQMLDPNGKIPTFVVNAVAPDRCRMPAKVNVLLKKKENWPAAEQVEFISQKHKEFAQEIRAIEAAKKK